MRHRLAALLLVLAVVAAAGSFAADDPATLTATHDPESKSYNGACLSCHADVLKQTTSDPRVQAFHNAMLPYTPGFNPRKGAQDKNCVYCHNTAIDFRQESGASLRRNVNVSACVNCHGRSGPGPVYFK